MSTMRIRHIAPAGAPIGLIDLARAAQLCLSTADVSDRLGRRIRERFAVRHSVLTSTGRAGMTVLLRALSRLSPRRTDVIVPSYTCYSVAASIGMEGANPESVFATIRARKDKF